MDQLSKLGPLQGLIRFWGTLSNTQKFITVLFAITSVALLVVVAMIATKPHMSVLFSGLQTEDAGSIVSKLQEEKIPYEIDGQTIKVPEKNVYELRMKLASQGLPQGGTVGFELFDKNSFGMTEFSQKLNYQRALQGELSRTIEQIDGVVSSKILLAIPEESVFSEKEKAPSASVYLKLRPGTRLDDEKVAGVVHLVSSAVQGMDAGHVTVVDMNGNMLSQASNDPSGLDPRMSSSQLKLKREYERVVEQDIQSMLERVLGASKVIVRANARINFDRKETDREIYDPINGDKGVLHSQSRLDETYNGSGVASGGVAGIASNLRGETNVSTNNVGKGGYNRMQTTTDYNVSKTIERTITAPGQVENMSVAVIVDGKVDSAKIPSINRAVAVAAGINEARGDKITVESIDFDNSEMQKEDKAMQAAANKSNMMSLAKSIGTVLVVLIFLFFLWRIIKQINIVVPQPVTVQEVSASEVGLSGYDSLDEVISGGTDFAESAPSGSAGSVKDRELVGAASSAQPQDIAQALRRWMSEN